MSKIDTDMLGVRKAEEVPFPQSEIDRLDQRKWILKFAQRGGCGAEIGVFRGHFSVVLAELLNPSRFFLVDPWRTLGETFAWGEGSPYTGYGKLTTQYAYDETKQRVAKFQSMDIRMVETTASDFFSKLDEKLDWIYLDASHHYEATLNELRLIHKALKVDGVIMGDDWQPNRGHKHHGVFRAVNEFLMSNPYEFVAAGPAAQWCIRRRQVASGRNHRVQVNKHSWILHVAIDVVRAGALKDGKYDIGGIVVLGPNSSKASTLWLLDGADMRAVRWGIDSPVIASSWPYGINKGCARFSINDVALCPDRPAQLFVMDESGARSIIAELTTVA